MKAITIVYKRFEMFISETKIQVTVQRLATELNRDFYNKEVILLAILNGTFMFAADLLRRINLDCSISFVKLSSYTGTGSNGRVSELIGINEVLDGKNIIVLEDIIDTGTTITEFLKLLEAYSPASVSVVTFLLKPGTCSKNVKPDYVGLEVPDKFVIGYGLDYMGKGRHFPFICSLADT